MRKTTLRLVAPLLAIALLGAACGGDDDDDGGAATASTESTETTEAADDGDDMDHGGDDAVDASDPTATGAATLRAGLTGLLTEHVYLAALATGAALRGDQPAFEAWATALNGEENSNTEDLVAAITSVYGDETGNAFEGLWRSEGHIPAFVAYTQAVATDDQAGADQAVADLLAYAKTFGETMSTVNENLPADAVQAAIESHVTDLKAVVDAQKAGDQPTVYASLRMAYHHMGETATVLAGATAAKFPDQLDGDVESAASGLRAGLTSLLREHVLLAASATGAALGGRTEQFEAAATALNGPSDSNTSDLVAAIGSVYGPDVETAFDGLWRSEGHIPGFVAYTQAVAADDQAAADAAIESLLAYAKTFGETIASVNENLPADAVQAAIEMHASELKAVIDAQKAGDPAEVARLTREAVAHMSGTADVLASGTAALFPDEFAA